MKIVAEIPDEIIDIISKSDTTIGRRELAIKANISENLARHYLQLWNSRVGDTDPRTIGMQDILKEKVSKQAKMIKKLQKELATGDIILDSMKDFIPVLDIKSKIPDCKYSNDKIDAREVIAIWNDWHSAEVIKPEQVEGLNEYNMQIMAGRIWNLVRGTIRIINLNKSIFNIDILNIDLLGDMVSGNIHDELIQTNEMPILQTTMATAYIAAQAIIMLTEHFRKIRITCVHGNHGRCLSKSMELLTKSGWKSYDEIEENEIIPTMNLETGYTEYEPIEQIHIYENDPTIVKTTGKINSGLEMTPDHSLINYDDRKKEFRKKYLVKDIINLKGGIKIPRYTTSNNIDMPNISDDLLELIGIIITDGSVIKDIRKICIYQSKPYNIPHIENLLNKNKINYTKSIRHRNITEVCGKKLKKKPFDENVFIVKASSVDYLLKYVLSRDIQDWMFDLSDRQVEILLKGIVLANGSVKPGSNRIMHDGKEYFVKEHTAIYGEKHFLDKLQALLVTHGRSCTLSKDNRGDYILHLLGNYFSILNKKVLIEEDYNDTTWCVTVPNGSIFVRNKDNGRVFIVGNTTQKYQFKNKALNNYDILFYQILSVLLSKYIDENIIEFNIPESSECIIVRSGWAFLLGHSDHIRGWSGIPWYGFQRDNAKQQKIRKLRSVLSVNENNMQPAEELNGAIINMKNARGVYGYDFRECGHWHTMSIVDDWTTIISGALVGTSEFSLNKLHATASPTQTLAFLSEKYGLKGIEPIHCVDEGHNFNIFKEGVLGEYAKALGEFVSSE